MNAQIDWDWESDPAPKTWVRAYVRLAKSRREGPFCDRIRDLAGRVRPMFQTTNEAFREDDPEKARQVVASHLENKAASMECALAIADSDLSADMALVYGSSARILRRISAHMSNIASSVVQPYDRIRHGDEDV